MAPMSADRHNTTRPEGYIMWKSRFQGEFVSWADVVLSCEYKCNEGVDDSDDVCAHQGLCDMVICLPLTLGHVQVHVEHATCHARRSMPLSHM